MITATHALVYADDLEKARAFFRDVLEWPYIDIHGGWLVYRLPPGELGVHPHDAHRPTGRHELWLMSDDLEADVARLQAKGVVFSTPIVDDDFGRWTMMMVPGADALALYQPKHPTAYNLP